MFPFSAFSAYINSILASLKYSALSSSNPKQQEAAVVIQSEYRRHRASQEVDELRQEQAAVQIQSTYRGYRDRKSIGKFTNQSNETEQTLEDDVPTASAPPVPFEEYSPQTEELRFVVSTLPRTSGTGYGEGGEVQQQQQPDVEANLKENHSTLITSTTATSSSTTVPATVTATTTSTENEPQTESIDTDEEKRTQAAICIQAHYRGHLSRKKYRVTVAIEKKDTECENTEQANESDSKPTVEITESESRSGSQNSQNRLLDESQNGKEPSEPATQTTSETEPEDQKFLSKTTKDRISDIIVEGTGIGREPEPKLQQSSLHDLEYTSSSQETQQLSESSEVTDQESCQTPRSIST
ncbi:hypothetical protein FGIG_00852 [Fasciola gigantica]|uniref:Uncharacterized protein n=1 Tax=Fasciola gigantica TaxID=46835 RepID=A0A504ZB37_FASGI|nr:hypothetical protein FGIG_00852 [Fasciola gigantica]